MCGEWRLDKLMDESCYYCIHSKDMYSLRDETKNTCNLINNKGWSSYQIKKCEYREKTDDFIVPLNAQDILLVDLVLFAILLLLILIL